MVETVGYAPDRHSARPHRTYEGTDVEFRVSPLPLPSPHRGEG